ncbi:hypothetical protein IJ818_08265 [bacterium]|nr:hypothetical protein [bacterium]
MAEPKNLETLTSKISNDLYATINLLDILEEVFDGKQKEGFLVSSIQKNIHKAFDNVELCRQLISKPD